MISHTTSSRARLGALTLAATAAVSLTLKTPLAAPAPGFCRVYTLVDLGPGSGFSKAWAINNNGQVTGTFAYPNQLERAYRTAPNSPVDAAALLPVPSGANRGFGLAIDQFGSVAGISTGRVHAALWHLGLRGGTNVDTPPFGEQSAVRGMDEAGWSVGERLTSGPDGTAPLTFQATLWYDPWTSTALTSWIGNPKHSGATDINGRAEIVGWADGNGFLFDMPRWRHLVLPSFIPSVITDDGLVAGTHWQTIDGSLRRRAALFQDMDDDGIADPDEFTVLDALSGQHESRVTAINRAGVAVGYEGGMSRHWPIGEYLGLDWPFSTARMYAGGDIIDLHTVVAGGTKGWTLVAAYGINDLGQIVGDMQGPPLPPVGARQTHAFRLDPQCGRYDLGDFLLRSPKPW